MSEEKKWEVEIELTSYDEDKKAVAEVSAGGNSSAELIAALKLVIDGIKVHE